MIKRFLGSVAGKIVGALLVAALGIGGGAAVASSDDDEQRPGVEQEDD